MPRQNKKVSSLLFFLLVLTPSFLAARGFAARVLGFACSNFAKKIRDCSQKERLIVVIIYRDAKRRGIYLALFTNPEGDSCFSIYQIRSIVNRGFRDILHIP